jgi:hypothetical protein
MATQARRAGCPCAALPSSQETKPGPLPRSTLNAQRWLWQHSWLMLQHLWCQDMDDWLEERVLNGQTRHGQREPQTADASPPVTPTCAAMTLNAHTAVGKRMRTSMSRLVSTEQRKDGVL